MRTEFYEKTTTEVPVATNVDIGEINLGGEADWISVEVTPTGAAIDAFILYGKAHPDGTYVSIKSSSWGTATGAMPITSGDIAATADAATGLFIYQVNGLDSVKFQASANTSIITSIELNATITYPS